METVTFKLSEQLVEDQRRMLRYIPFVHHLIPLNLPGRFVPRRFPYPRHRPQNPTLRIRHMPHPQE